MESLNDRISRFLSYNSGSGSGYGYGYGYGYGSGDGSGSGDGYGYGDGDGDGIKTFSGMHVYLIDGVQTLIESVRHGFAKGYILGSDLQLTPCFIANGSGKFAHGKTIKEAVSALQSKLFKDMPEDERISAFVDAFPGPSQKIPARELWVWHNRLTGSCEMGRNQFAKDHGIDLDSDAFTPLEFCEMCKNSYGGDIICKLEKAYMEDRT